MTDFVTVSDTLRDEYRASRGGGPKIGLTSALVSGATVFVAGRSQKSFGGYYGQIRAKGLRLVTRNATIDGVQGVLAWAEDAA